MKIWGAFGDPEARYEVDFECPHGVPWEVRESPTHTPHTQTPPKLADDRITAHCRTCEKYQNRRCLLYLGGHCTPCQFRAYLNQPGAICPASLTRFAVVNPATQKGFTEAQ